MNNNRLVDFRKTLLSGRRRNCNDRYLASLQSRTAIQRTDISDHLETIYVQTAHASPKLIVELGTRGGESTLALQAGAERNDAIIVSVDLQDCSHACSYRNWHFVQDDDIHYATVFEDWCRQRGLTPEIDVLFVDTSHEYLHTCREISTWFPFLAPSCTVMFHDTNMECIYQRSDGSLGAGWENERGVIRALEEFFATSFDEKKNFTATLGDWQIKHSPYCSGFTVLTRGNGAGH